MVQQNNTGVTPKIDKSEQIVAKTWLKHYEEEGRLNDLLESGLLLSSEIEKIEKLRKRAEIALFETGKKLTRLAFDQFISAVIIQEYDEFMDNNYSITDLNS